MTGLQTSVIPLFNTLVHTVQYIFPLQDPPGTFVLFILQYHSKVSWQSLDPGFLTLNTW